LPHDRGPGPERGTPSAGGRLTVLSAASARLVGEPDPEQVARVLVEQAASVLAAGDVQLGLLDADPAWWVLRAAVGPAAEQVGERQPRGAGLLGQVMQDGASVRLDDLRLHPLAALEPNGAALGSLIAVPLRFEGEVLGAVLAARPPGEPVLGAGDEAVLQMLADLTAARLGLPADTRSQRARAQELASIDPVWRPSVEQAGDFVIITGARDSPFLDADQAACRILGYPREVLLQRSMRDIIPLPPGSERVDTLAAVRDQMLRGLPITFDTLVRRRDGAPLPVRLTIQRVDPSSDPPVYRCTFWDLSQEKDAQVRTLVTEKQRLLQEMGSAIAHELNTPLAVVLGNTEMLLDEVQEQDLRELLQPAYNAAQQISQVVQRLQRFAKPSSSSGWASLDLSQLTAEVAENACLTGELAPQTEGGAIALRLETSPVAAVRGNPIDLQDAVRELLANAAQAMPDGGTIVVSTRAMDGWVSLTVEDTGIGMSDEVRQRCLEPFFTTRRPVGNGLGLNRVYHTVLQHRGHLQVESTEDRGTRVTISLPAESEDSDAPSTSRRTGDP